jgi:hypothetical protein
MGSLVHTGLGSSSLAAHVLPYPPPPHVNSFVLGPAVINTLTHTASHTVPFQARGILPVAEENKVGLTAAKAAALRINLNVEGCGIVAAPVHAPSRAPLDE